VNLQPFMHGKDTFLFCVYTISKNILEKTKDHYWFQLQRVVLLEWLFKIFHFKNLLLHAC